MKSICKEHFKGDLAIKYILKNQTNIFMQSTLYTELKKDKASYEALSKLTFVNSDYPYQ